MAWFNIDSQSPKFNLHHLRKISTGFKMAMLTPKSSINWLKKWKFRSLSHNLGNCPAYNRICKSCKKKEHYTQSCFMKDIRVVNQVEETLLVRRISWKIANNGYSINIKFVIVKTNTVQIIDLKM